MGKSTDANMMQDHRCRKTGDPGLDVRCKERPNHDPVNLNKEQAGVRKLKTIFSEDQDTIRKTKTLCSEDQDNKSLGSWGRGRQGLNTH